MNFYKCKLWNISENSDMVVAIKTISWNATATHCKERLTWPEIRGFGVRSEPTYFVEKRSILDKEN